MNPLLTMMKLRHDLLDKLLRMELACANPDDFRIQTLKRKKLALKDRIAAQSKKEVSL